MDHKKRKIEAIVTELEISAEQVQKYLQDIMENSQDVLFRYNFKLKTLSYISNSIEALTGYIPQEYIEQGPELWIRNIHPEDQQRFIQLYPGNENNDIRNSSFQLEYRIRHKDGHWVWVSDSTSIIRNDQGEVEAAIGFLRDMTDLKAQQQQYHASEQRFKNLAEATFEAIAIHRDSRIIDANQPYLDMFGYALEEVKTIPGIQMIAPQSRDLVQEKMSSHYEGAYEAFGMKKDGTIFPVKIQTKETFLDDEPIRIAAICDMTDKFQQEQLFKAVFESLQDCVAVVDKDYNNLYMNQPAKKQIREICGQYPTENMRDTLPHAPEFMRLWMSRVEEIFKIKKPKYYEDIFSAKNQTFYSETTMAPISYPDGDMFAVSIVYRDLTEQKRLQKQYTEQAQLFQTLLEGSNVLVVVTDTEGNHLFANHAVSKYFGISREQLIGRNITELFPEDIVLSIRNKIRETLEKKETLVFTEIIEFQGQKRWLQQTCHPLLDSEGNCDRIMVIAYDVHNQKLLEAKFRKTQARYKELYYNAPVALFRTGLDGILLDCNKASLVFFGYPSDENPENYLNKIRVTDYYTDKNRRKEFIAALMKDKRVRNFEVELKQADGAPFWASISAEIFLEAGYIEGSMYDITINKNLTKTEKAVLNSLMQGKSNKEIARTLGRSVRTVEDHRSHIMQKLGVDNAFDLAKKAMELGFTPKL